MTIRLPSRPRIMIGDRAGTERSSKTAFESNTDLCWVTRNSRTPEASQKWWAVVQRVWDREVSTGCHRIDTHQSFDTSTAPCPRTGAHLPHPASSLYRGGLKKYGLEPDWALTVTPTPGQGSGAVCPWRRPRNARCASAPGSRSAGCLARCRRRRCWSGRL